MLLHDFFLAGPDQMISLAAYAPPAYGSSLSNLNVFLFVG